MKLTIILFLVLSISQVKAPSDAITFKGKKRISEIKADLELVDNTINWVSNKRIKRDLEKRRQKLLAQLEL